MPNPKMTKTQRISELERKLAEAQAQLIHVYHFAKIGVRKADREKVKGGGIIVRLNYTGGKEVCPAFMIKDGFSPETIEHLCADIQYSYDNSVMFPALPS